MFTPSIFVSFILFLLSPTSCLLAQVATLNFGDFYDAQFVKLYTFFTAQFQVKSNFIHWCMVVDVFPIL